jgi:SAM-dependent methyltransferase
MGSATIQGELWGRAPRDWAELQEPTGTPLWEAMLDAAGVSKGTRFLDVGCGGGGASLLAAERGAQVSGLDAAAPMIEVARERLPEADWRVGDMEALPYDDGSFDAVFSANSLQYAADRVQALGEFKRVCAPGGRIAVGLWDSPDKVEFRAVFAAVVGALPEPPPGEGPFELSLPGVIEGLMEQAGLAVLDSGAADCPFVYPDFELLWKGNAAAGPTQGAIRAVGEEKLKAAIRDVVGAFRVNGYIRFENSMRYVVGTR